MRIDKWLDVEISIPVGRKFNSFDFLLIYGPCCEYFRPIQRYDAQSGPPQLGVVLVLFFFILIATELQPRVRGWLLASVDGKTTGLIPANHVTVLGKRRGTNSAGQAQQPQLPPSDSGISLSQAYNNSVSDSGISLSQAYNNSVPQLPQQPAANLENEFDSMFGVNHMPSSNTPAPAAMASAAQEFVASSRDTNNQDASEILNDVDKGT